VPPEKAYDEVGNLYKIRLGFKDREGNCMWNFDEVDVNVP
jgi:hypothetical protein